MDDATLFEKLLHAEDEATVDEVLKRAGYGLDNEGAWRALGDMENNFSTVGNQQTEATAALVEKVINGIDAVLMAECFRGKINPEGPEAPATMSAAVERFFKVREGLLANLDAKRQTELANNIHLVAVGEKSAPCYLIVDRGEGQTPDAFPNTFLSLNRSNKLRIPFVQGKFNSGGTGVLQFCGQHHNMQLIVSKRHPEAPVSNGDASRDLWGFTIVRRMRPADGRRSSIYVYLAPQGKVPRFESEAVKVLPEDRKSVCPRPYAVGLPFGTCVKLYGFRWKAKSIATTDARYELERFLQSPCLPFRLTETREYKANYFSTTVAGVWATVGSGDDGEDSKIEAGFPAYAELNLRGVGQLPYRMVVFQPRKKAESKPHGIFFTVNGQVHGSLPSDFVTRQLKLQYLSDDLLVSIDCTAMDQTVREDFFMASRDRVRKNEVYTDVVEHIKDALKDHAGLRLLNAARQKKEIEETLSDEEETKNLFNELLKADPMLARLFGSGDRLVTKTGPPEVQPFVGKKFPTYFRLAKNPADGLVKHCPVNLTCRVELDTDAVNDYFKRTDCPGSINIDPPNLVEHSNLWNGRFTLLMRAPWNAKPGDKIDVKISVSDIQTETKSPFVSRFTLVADPEAQPRKPGGNGGGGRRNPPGGTVSTPTLAIPEVREKHFGDPRPSLEVRYDANNQYDYWLNLDNAYLVTELTRAKEETKPLVKFWFKYGLVLCALGMLKEQQDRIEAKKKTGEASNGEDTESGEDLKQVNLYCDGIARVIVSIIRTLPRGPELIGA
jgi:hypothetical protein